MKEIIVKALQIKIAIEIQIMDDDTLDMHLMTVNPIIIFGYDYLKTNPQDVYLDVTLDIEKELKELTKLIRNCKPSNKEEKSFITIVQEIIKH